MIIIWYHLQSGGETKKRAYNFVMMEWDTYGARYIEMELLVGQEKWFRWGTPSGNINWSSCCGYSLIPAARRWNIIICAASAAAAATVNKSVLRGWIAGDVCVKKKRWNWVDWIIHCRRNRYAESPPSGSTLARSLSSYFSIKSPPESHLQYLYIPHDKRYAWTAGWLVVWDCTKNYEQDTTKTDQLA